MTTDTMDAKMNDAATAQHLVAAWTIDCELDLPEADWRKLEDAVTQSLVVARQEGRDEGEARMMKRIAVPVTYTSRELELAATLDAERRKVAELREWFEASFEPDDKGVLHQSGCIGLHGYGCKAWCANARAVLERAKCP